MATKAQRLAALKKQYENSLKELESEADDNDTGVDIVVLAGPERKQILAKLEELGYSVTQAEEIVEEIEEDVEEGGDKDDAKKPPKKTAKKVTDETEEIEEEEEIPVKDEKPPSRHSYFGRKG